jgi:hypothetical protein
MTKPVCGGVRLGPGAIQGVSDDIMSCEGVLHELGVGVRLR